MQKVCRRLMLVVKQGKLGCLGHALLLQGAKHLPHRAPFPVPCRSDSPEAGRLRGIAQFPGPSFA